MRGGAMPFLMMVSLVNSAKERDLNLLNSYMWLRLHGQIGKWEIKKGGNQKTYRKYENKEDGN